MKKWFSILKNSPIILVLVAVLLFFTPSALAKSPESARNAIVTMMGVDKEGDLFEITLLSFIPTPGEGFVASYNVSSTKGETLSKAMTDASLQLGKEVELFHTEIAILGKGVLDENVGNVLDFFSREESLTSSAILIGTNKTARDVIEFLQKEDCDPSDKLGEILVYNCNYVYNNEVTIENFYTGYFSPMKSSYIAYLSFDKTDDNDGVMLSDSCSGGGDEKKEEPDEMKDELRNNGELVLFKKGKKVGIMNREVVDGLNWITPGKIRRNVVIENFSDEEVHNAKVVFYVDNKELIRSVRFENGVPIFAGSLKVYVERIEIYGDKEEEGKNIQLSHISDKVKTKIEVEIRKELAKAVDYLRENKADIAGIGREFYLKDRGNFEKFLKSIDDKEDFLNFVIFELNIDLIAD